MTTKTRTWIRAALAAAVTGASNAGLASLGISGANLAGVEIPPLNWAQLGVMCLSGGVVGLLAYLKQSPLPPNGADPDARLARLLEEKYSQNKP